MLDDEEKKKLKYSLVFPLVFILFLWIIKLFEEIDNLGMYQLGVYPREFGGLPGILFSPFIHGDFNHLFSNTGPLLILGTGIIYFYRSLAYKVVGFVWIVSGFCVWLGARESYHIGASGLIWTSIVSFF
jgi:membrane associated rhomboid family serine protease